MEYNLTEEFKNYVKSHKGSRSKVKLICPSCKEEFFGTKNDLLGKLAKNRVTKCCSKQCALKLRSKSITKPCAYCKKPVTRQAKEAAKVVNIFCNHSCAAKYNNQHRTIDPERMRRSYAEEYLVKLITKNFPELKVQENVRDILQNGLEIDILLPTLNIAIELNGPLHYFPIYGQEKLELIQDRDLRKQIELQQLRYNLVIIDISTLSGKKKTEKFLNKYFDSKLKQIINGAR